MISPAGWDNEKKMAILQENMNNIKPEDFYNEIIQKPVVTRKVRQFMLILFKV